MTRPSFTTLPTEILETIFLDLDPRSLISVSQTSKFIKHLTLDSPIIWRYLCQTQFRTWHPRHNIDAKFAGPLSDVDWRSLYIEKFKVGARARSLLDCVVRTQHQRIRCITELADIGYDAKETLLRELKCPDDAHDVLARRFYANAVLERIHREIAINTWQRLLEGDDMPIERALGAYDMFARMGDDVDLHIIENDLDQFAAAIMHAYPDFHNLSPRMKASTLATCLRDQGFKGVSDRSYNAIGNSFIGFVIRSTDHESLPLISVAIYCALARRVGLDARPCGFLFHVYTLIYAPPNQDLNGKYKPSSSSSLDYMYIDPFRSSDEVHQSDLRRKLREMGVPRSEHPHFLSDTTTKEMVLRTARNIMTSVQRIRDTPWLNPLPLEAQTPWRSTYIDLDNAFYATIWSMLILGPPDVSEDIAQRRSYLPYLIEHFEKHSPWDVTLLEQYVIPLFYNRPEGQRLLQFVQAKYQADLIRKPVVKRDNMATNITFKVGQLFHHKRYNYEGVITGWDINCEQGEEWIQGMGVDRLSSGKNQAFYNVLVFDKSVRYVAEENIEPASPNTKPSQDLLRLAGCFFKRWDDERNLFVSNIQDEYPDD
ncbi:Hemimethylated DNA-binding protein YccV like-domain-containing protein [Phaeosphaeriaceae sp. PMI808]|nr:Hemimethylated DNA-binding protein YccV like-domain-containing protein [Phaeosphaeriaceae sp. PMI808]